MEKIEINSSSSSQTLSLEKLYVPEKSKETQFRDGNPEEIASKVVDIVTNEIKVLRRDWFLYKKKKIKYYDPA